MNRDPFGLGAQLYGFQAVPDTFAITSWGALDGVVDLDAAGAHEACWISSFCRAPLHPGPCKGWKKKLGTDAPGVLKAIEAARKEKLAAKRKATADAKGQAQKALTGRQLASPLHAKKATIKAANQILGNDEAKAGGKAAKVILNKQEIKKYSKIKSAQMNALRAKHGLPEDTGLEDRIAEALAKDNTVGKDDNYRSTLAVAAQSLGAQLAQKACKKGDGDCDGKPYEWLRDTLETRALDALTNGDDSGLSKTLDDYEAGKIGYKPEPEPEPAPKADAAAPAKPKAAGKKPVVSVDALATFDKAMANKDKAAAMKALDSVTPEEYDIWPVSAKGDAEDLLAQSNTAKAKEIGDKLNIEVGTAVPAKKTAAKKAADALADTPGQKGAVYGLGFWSTIKGNKTLGAKKSVQVFADKIDKALPEGDPNGIIPQAATQIAETALKKVHSDTLSKPAAMFAPAVKKILTSKLEAEAVQGLKGEDGPKPVSDLVKKALRQQQAKDFAGFKETVVQLKEQAVVDSLANKDKADKIAAKAVEIADTMNPKANASSKKDVLSSQLNTDLAAGNNDKIKTALQKPVDKMVDKAAPEGASEEFKKEQADKIKAELEALVDGDGDTPTPELDAVLTSIKAAPAVATPAATPGLSAGDEVKLSKTLDGPDVGPKTAAIAKLSKDDYDALDPSVHKQVEDHVKAELNAYMPGTESDKQIQAIASKLGIENDGPAWTPPADVVGGSTLGETGATAAEIDKSVKIAQGYITATHAKSIEAHDKLTKADFDALPGIDQLAIMDDLNDAINHSKIADIKVKAAQVKAKLTGISLEDKGKPGYEISPEAEKAAGYAGGSLSGTAKQKLAAYDALPVGDFEQMQPGIKSMLLADLDKMKAKFLDPKKQAQVDQIKAKLSVGTGGGAGAGGDATPATVDPTPAEQAKVVDALFSWASDYGPHLGGEMVQQVADGSNPAEGAAFFIAGTFVGKQAKKLGLTALDLGAENLQKLIVDLEDDFKEAIAKGLPTGTPGGPAEGFKNAVIDIKQSADQLAANNGWAADDPALTEWKKAALQAELELALNPSTPGSSAPPMGVPAATPAGAGGTSSAPNPAKASIPPIGTGTSLDGIDDATQKAIMEDLKGFSEGKYLADDKKVTYGNLLTLAAVYGTEDKPLSVLQVLKSVDNAFAKKLGVTNTNNWENAFVDWLATPEGKKFAEDNPTPDANLVKKLKGVYDGITTDLNELAKKVQLLPGPGGFDTSKPSSDFKVISGAEADKIRAQQLADQGGEYTQSQKEGIWVYTSNDYIPINKWLRGLQSDLSTNHKQAIRKAQDAMRPLPQDLLLHRGTGWDALPEGFRSANGAKKLIGKTVMDEAFMSASVGGSPGGPGAGKPLILEIEAPAGTMAAYVDGKHKDGKSVSTFPAEREFLLAAGQQYQIISVDDSAGWQTTVRVRIVTPNA